MSLYSTRARYIFVNDFYWLQLLGLCARQVGIKVLHSSTTLVHVAGKF